MSEYHTRSFKEIGEKLRSGKTQWETMAMKKHDFEIRQHHLGEDIGFVQLDKLVVNLTTYTQYIYNVNDPSKLVDHLNYNIEEMQGVISELEKAKKRIINDCKNKAIKRELIINEMLDGDGEDT